MREIDIQAIEEHLAAHVGEIAYTHMDPAPGELGVHIFHIKPSELHNFHTLVTCGVSAQAMEVPPEHAPQRYLELMLCLPADWSLEGEALQQEQSVWPIFLLRMLGRYPHQESSWLGWGHSISNGEPPKPYQGQDRFCGSFLLEPALFAEEMKTVQIDEEKTVQFLAVIPLFASELSFVDREGALMFQSVLTQKNVSELVDVERENSAPGDG